MPYGDFCRSVLVEQPKAPKGCRGSEGYLEVVSDAVASSSRANLPCTFLRRAAALGGSVPNLSCEEYINLDSDIFYQRSKTMISSYWSHNRQNRSMRSTILHSDSLSFENFESARDANVGHMTFDTGGSCYEL